MKASLPSVSRIKHAVEQLAKDRQPREHGARRAGGDRQAVVKSSVDQNPQPLLAERSLGVEGVDAQNVGQIDRLQIEQAAESILAKGEIEQPPVREVDKPLHLGPRDERPAEEP